MRTPSSDKKTDLKKGSWSLEEDQKLVLYINKYGIWNWSQMPRFAGLSRSGKSCRLRWMNYLQPNVKRGKFSADEEQIILQSHSELGNRWSAIASRLPGRTDNDVKNYWYTHLKKRATKHNLVCESTKQSGMNSTTSVNTDDMNYANYSKSQFSFEDDSTTSSSSITTPKDHEVELRPCYYDTGSPGTIDDLERFWDQLCPFENLELGNSERNVFSDTLFQDSYIIDNSMTRILDLPDF